MSKTSRAVIIVFSLLLILSISPSSVQASTNVDTDITTNTTWTSANSPYVVSVPINVASGATLTLEPGTIVKFDSPGSLSVDGSVNSLGNKDNPVYFTSLLDDSIGGDTNNDSYVAYPSIGDWGGISINNSNTQSKFNNTFIEFTYYALSLTNSDVLSDGLNINNSYYGISADGGINYFNNLTTSAINGQSIILDYSSVLNLNNSSLNSESSWGGTVISVYDGSNLNVKNSNIIQSGWAGTGVSGSYGSSLSFENSSISSSDDNFNVYRNANLILKDTILTSSRDGIVLFNNSSMTISGGSMTHDGYGVAVFNDSTATISDFTVTGGREGMYVSNNSNLTVNKSIIKNSYIGILSFDDWTYTQPNHLFITKTKIFNNHFGLSLDDVVPSISGNSIHDNILGAYTRDVIDVDVKNNWWGDASGPYNATLNPSGKGNEVGDYILFDPWLVAEPTDKPCCSSVIFVPGFEGSRLYQKNNNGNLNQRWEPGILSPTDVSSLMLDDNGNSIKNIVTKDIIERTNYPIDNKDIFKKVAGLLRDEKTNNIIKDFLLFPYDWRLDINDIAQNGTNTDAGVANLKDQIVSLASNSKSGQVTLIGHSNGGLLIKKTIALLKTSGQDNLVDKVIVVASPQLGTPEAIAEILHGNNTSFGGGFVMTEMRGRYFAQNMPGAYGLLPSKKLYDKVGTFINFLKETFSTDWYKQYGETLDYNEQNNFFTGGDGRAQPALSQLEIPNILRQPLLDKAKILHDDIDNLTLPETIPIYEIAGIGRPTVQGITYESSLLGLASPKHKLNLSCDGDQTVIPESAVDYNTNPYYINLFSYFNDTGVKFAHANIMENPEIVDLISNITTNTDKSTPHITNAKPDLTNCRFKVFGMFSPADIDVYDSQGRHTGINQNQSTNNFIATDTEIPNSDFITIGNEKYAIVPDTGNYTVKINGTGTGVFTLDVSTQDNDQIVNRQTYADLPVTPKLIGEITIPQNITTDMQLKLDTNGDGRVDETVLPNTATSPLSYLEALKAMIISLDLKPKDEKKMLKRIDEIAKLIGKGKIDKATAKLQKLLKTLESRKEDSKHMTEKEKDDSVEKINKSLDNF